MLRRRLATSFSPGRARAGFDGARRFGGAAKDEAVFDTLAPAGARFPQVGDRCSTSDWSDSIKRLDRVRRRCLQRIRHATLLKALNTWVHGRDLYRFLEGHSIKATSALRRVLKRWLHREKSKAMESWFLTVRFIRGMERVVARIVHRLVAKAWVTWTGDVSAGLHRRALHLRGALDCQRCVQLWYGSELEPSQVVWSCVVLRGTSAAIRHLNE